MKRYKKFINLSKKIRKDKVFQLKNKIKNCKENCSSKFYTHLMLAEPDRNPEFNQWFDIYFPSKKRKDIIWNACITTTRQELWDTVSNMAFEEESNILTLEERINSIKMVSKPASYDKKGKILTYSVEFITPTFEKLGGLTSIEYRENLEREIISTKPPKVYEYFKIQKNYAYGIGLHMVIDVPYLTKENMEEAVEKFFSIGERNWISKTSASEDNLIFQIKKDYFGKFSNT
jgi:hypothetical protein